MAVTHAVKLPCRVRAHSWPPAGKSNPSVLKGRKAMIEGGVQVACVYRFLKNTKSHYLGKLTHREKNEALPGPVPSVDNTFVGKNTELVHLQEN